jgi:hypothetical protein
MDNAINGRQLSGAPAERWLVNERSKAISDMRCSGDDSLSKSHSNSPVHSQGPWTNNE